MCCLPAFQTCLCCNAVSRMLGALHGISAPKRQITDIPDRDWYLFLRGMREILYLQLQSVGKSSGEELHCQETRAGALLPRGFYGSSKSPGDGQDEAPDTAQGAPSSGTLQAIPPPLPQPRSRAGSSPSCGGWRWLGHGRGQSGWHWWLWGDSEWHWCLQGCPGRAGALGSFRECLRAPLCVSKPLCVFQSPQTSLTHRCHLGGSQRSRRLTGCRAPHLSVHRSWKK